MLSHEQVLDEFRAAGALPGGTFHSVVGAAFQPLPAMRQSSRDPARAARLCEALAEQVRALIKKPIELIASPAMGGVVVGYEMGRQLGVSAIFLERVDGKLALRRGFTIGKGVRVLMVEDVVTTGLSSRECIAGILEEGGVTVGAACLIDRSGGKAQLGVPLAALTRLDVPAYAANGLPPELVAIPPVKPGSRGLT